MPAVRSDLQIIPASHRDQTVFVIQDQLEIVPNGLALNQESINLLILMDQSESITDFMCLLTRMQGGILASRNDVDHIVEEFDRMNLLDTPRYRELKQKIVDDFVSQDVRSPALAGTGYPAEPDKLQSFIGGILESSAIGRERSQTPNRIKAIVAPHIDFQVGRRVYGSAYSAWPDPLPQRVLLLGTGHSLTGGFFSVTAKHFETVLGTLPTDQSAAEQLKTVAGDSVASDDFAHRTEHSLEYQTIFIRHLMAQEPVTCLPILCGAFSQLVTEVDKPSDSPSISEFLHVLKKIAQEPGTLIVAGVDFSHIGPKFGDEQPSRRLEQEARKHDQALLEALINGDLHAFWQESRRVEDRYNVCGLSALATLLEIVGGPLEGEVLDYDMWHEEATQSAVSFAAVLLWERGK